MGIDRPRNNLGYPQKTNEPQNKQYALAGSFHWLTSQ